MLDKAQLNSLFRYGLALTNNEPDAYDLLQEAITRCLAKSGTELTVPYLKVVMKNAFIDRYRRLKKVPFESLDDEETIELNSDWLDTTTINKDELNNLLQDLGYEDRELLYLSAVEENTASEIANMQGKSRGTILSRLHRIKLKVRRQFKSEGQQ